MISFRGHRKRKRLKRRLGPEATDYLIDLWIGAAIARPDGILHGWNENDIADEADFPGDPIYFVNALIDCGWLEKSGDSFILHDWTDNQPWVVGAKMRSEAARKAAMARWNKSFDASKNGDRLRQTSTDGKKQKSRGDKARSAPAAKPRQTKSPCAPHCGPDPARNAPSPNPSPNPSPMIKPDRTGPENVKSRHYGDLIDPNIVKRINRAGIDVLKLSKTKVNPFAFVQDCANRNYHPAAIAETLEYIVANWTSIRSFWTYARTTASNKSRNYYGRQAETEAQQFKAIAVDNDQLKKLLQQIGA